MVKATFAKVGSVIVSVAIIVLGVTVPDTGWIDQHRAIWISIVALIAIVVGGLLWLYGTRARRAVVDNVSLLGEIKSDLVILNTSEKETATQKALEPCPKEMVIKIHGDFISVFGDNTMGTIVTMLQDIVFRRSVDPLINFFKKIGDILDSDEYGLKTLLESNDLYKSTRNDLQQKRVKLKLRKRRSIIVQKNIDRTRALSYGLSSSILFRGVFDTFLEEVDALSAIKVALEGVESAAEVTLTAMLNDLENKWTVSKETIQGIESIVAVLSLLKGAENE